MTLREVRSKKIMNGNVIPLLDEVFRLSKDKICVNVEFKGEDLEGAFEVMKLCKAHKNLDQVHFSSFNWKFAEALDSARKTLGIEARQPFGFLTNTFDIADAFTIGQPGDGVTFGWHMLENSKDEFPALANQIVKNDFRVKVYFAFVHKEIRDDYDFLESVDMDTVITNDPFLMARYYQEKSERSVTVVDDI